MSRSAARRALVGVLCAFAFTGCGSSGSDQTDDAHRQPDRGSVDASSARLADSGFKTPEAALQNLVTGLNSGDFDMIVSSFAVERYVDNFDFVAQAERTLALQPRLSLMPSDQALYRELNAYERAHSCLAQVKTMIYSMISNEREAVRESLTIRDEDGAKSRAFAASVDPAKLETLTVVRTVELPASGSSIEAQAEKIAKARATVVGADETTEFVVLYQLGDETFKGGFSALRYGDSWSIDTLGSPLGGTDSSGAVATTSPDEFDAETRSEE
jgi:hypothetical protein